jgi:iron complex outermembrane recepter protein
MSGRMIMWIAVCTLTFSGPGNAGPPEYHVNIANGPLSSGLSALQSQTGIELLYDRNVVREFQAPSVVGTLTTDAALQQLVSETELTVRRAASGAWIIERRATPPLEQQDAAVAEILVEGRRTQNADIRRTEEDVQPYVVATGGEIRRAHRENIDDFMSTRITANTSTIPSISSQSADVMSSIDLRGLGARDTVVLVDGRRMPSIGDENSGFSQSDVNAIPLHAIKRIEVLTGTAGGIHGFGALGGVVNIVLDREVDGLEFHTTQGISSRGDARRRGLEAIFGRSFGDGATDFSVSASHQELDTLLVHDRGFAVRDRRRTFEVAPDYFPIVFPHGSSITVRSLFGLDPDTGELVTSPKLTFKPEFGGGPLGSNLAYLPIGFSGDDTALVATLKQRAGEPDFTVPEKEATSDLGSNPKSDSLLANMRHRFESGWEAYADAVLLRTRGQSFNSTQSALGLFSGAALMAPESPANPFTDYIMVDYPIVGLESSVRKRIDNTRYTAGVESALPFDWRATAEVNWGGLEYVSSSSVETAPLGLFYTLMGDPSDLDTNPLGDWDAFNGVVLSNVMRSRTELEFRTRFTAQSLRLAGPVFDTRAGPATLTLLAERRSERVVPGRHFESVEWGAPPITSEFKTDPRSRITYSYYGELRTRLFDETARVPLIRALELQLAVRRDEQKDVFQRNEILPDPGFIHTRFAATALTLGAKISPTPWLMLRGSYTTGEQPPPIAHLQEYDPFPATAFGETDPKRGDSEVGVDGEFSALIGGNPQLDSAHANTLFAGLVLTPTGPEGPRLSVDYSRIRRSGDVVSFTYAHVLAHEDRWPDRIVREPLADADRALGYTGGAVVLIDARDHNDAAREVDAFDLRAEWPLSLLNGRLRLYADASYQKRNTEKTRFQPDLGWAGYLEGPLKRRANGGFDWSKTRLTIGANLQYYGSSLIFGRDILSIADETSEMIQGSTRIPSQIYLDLYGSWRFPVQQLGPVDSFTFDFGIVNALDKAPPRENTMITTYGPGYSRYGDARMRRFELGVSCQF